MKHGSIADGIKNQSIYIEYMAPALRKYSHLKDWKSADKALGDNDSKVIGNNTKLVRLSGGDIAVLLHGNRVVRYNTNGDVQISSAEWKTTTTKDRLNRYTDSKTTVRQSDFDWYVMRGGNRVEFRDGMTVYNGRGRR